jgi:hypothetical protein
MFYLDLLNPIEEVTGTFVGLDRQLLICILEELQKRRKCTIVYDADKTVLGVKFA